MVSEVLNNIAQLDVIYFYETMIWMDIPDIKRFIWFICIYISLQ